MHLDKNKIEHISNLARIELKPEEKQKFSEQLSSVLDYFNKLSQLKIEPIQDQDSDINLENIYRTDEAKNCPEDVRENILSNRPQPSGRYFKVSKIL